jgi:threonine synthase
MALERIVVKETEFPERMNWNLVQQWAEIPLFPESNPDKPEWGVTPVITADLSKDGYGVVHIKNEADTSVNPTGTIKDRAAWELATLYRDFARGIVLRNNQHAINGNITDIPVPRLSVITAGNVGKAVSYAFSKHGLPPVKLLVDENLPRSRLQALKKLHADVYATDLNRKLTAKDAQRLTNNEEGIEITSFIGIEPHSNFYDWHVHQALNEEPDEVYVPYGSGRLMENYLTWQLRSLRNTVQKRKDRRLKAPVSKVISTDVFGAEPEDPDSIADKLTKKFNPFVLFKEPDIKGLKTFGATGKATGVYKVTEEKIRQAYEIMNRYCPAEPSAAAGLALYLQRHEAGLVNPREKVLVINTGKGI